MGSKKKPKTRDYESDLFDDFDEYDDYEEDDMDLSYQ